MNYISGLLPQIGAQAKKIGSSAWEYAKDGFRKYVSDPVLAAASAPHSAAVSAPHSAAAADQAAPVGALSHEDAPLIRGRLLDVQNALHAIDRRTNARGEIDFTGHDDDRLALLPAQNVGIEANIDTLRNIDIRKESYTSDEARVLRTNIVNAQNRLEADLRRAEAAPLAPASHPTTPPASHPTTPPASHPASPAAVPAPSASVNPANPSNKKESIEACLSRCIRPLILAHARAAEARGAELQIKRQRHKDIQNALSAVTRCTNEQGEIDFTNDENARQSILAAQNLGIEINDPLLHAIDVSKRRYTRVEARNLMSRLETAQKNFEGSIEDDIKYIEKETQTFNEMWSIYAKIFEKNNETITNIARRLNSHASSN